MDAYEQTQDEAAAVAGDDALRAALDQMEAAERELQAAEEARKARAEEAARAAEEVEHALDQSIEACTSERDAIRVQLRTTEERLHELEAMKSRRRIERLTAAVGTAAANGEGEVASNAEAEVSVPEDTAADESPAGGSEGSYEDGWYGVLKQQDNVGDEMDGVETDPASQAETDEG
jgi:chromosome segregation ATPase